MTIEVWLTISLSISLLINFVLAWFSREQSRRLFYISETLEDLILLIQGYREHLKKIYSLDAFYGDASLEALMSHTRSLIKILEDDYSETIQITEPLKILQEEIEKDEQEKISQEGKDVFYAGTRNSNT